MLIRKSMYMYSKRKPSLILFLFVFFSCTLTMKSNSDGDDDKILIQMIMYALKNQHFNPIDMNDDFSQEVFSSYIELTDPMKHYFYKSDMNYINKYKHAIDDQITMLDISFFKMVNTRVKERIQEAKIITEEILSKPFDYKLNETIDVDYENYDYVRNKKEMEERWRKHLKFVTISNYHDLIKAQESEENKEPDTNFEQEARETTKKTMETYFQNIEERKIEEWFSIYVGAIVGEYDPHTYYLEPKSKEDFDLRMSGKFEGIGAVLRKVKGYVKVIELIPGGPAWKGKELEEEDLILKVKQEDQEYPINVVGMRLSDAIKHIKGPKGTKVTLTIKKASGTINNIDIIRDVVEISETYAKSSVIEEGNNTYGILNLPSFYADFKDYKNKNAASDVKKEIERLKEDGIEGLILDLRNNGGGSLNAVVDMAGLFIPKGPVVQVRSSNNSKRVLKDNDKSVTWDGPLVILVNEISASASEILAAAMQDYKRAIIIGGKQTYGKGTVQNIIDLNKMLRYPNKKDYGSLGVTTRKYYRINGGSVQLEGVKSDITVPTRFSFDQVGEKDTDNPLPWDEIDTVVYDSQNYSFDYNTLIENSKKRIENNKQFNIIKEKAKCLKEYKDENTFSLNYTIYENSFDVKNKKIETFDSAISEYETDLVFHATKYDLSLFNEKDKGLSLKESREKWFEKLTHDVYVDEAVNVIRDMKKFSALVTYN